MTKRNLHFVIWKEGKYYVARSLEVEVVSQGKTRKKAVVNLQEALELYFEDKDNIKTPTIKAPQIESLSFPVNA